MEILGFLGKEISLLWLIWSARDHNCLIICLFLYLYVFPKKARVIFCSWISPCSLQFLSTAMQMTRNFCKWHCFHNLEQSLKLKDTLAIFCSPGLSSVLYFWGIAVCKGICQSNSKHGLFPSENPRIILTVNAFTFSHLKFLCLLKFTLKQHFEGL